MKLLFVGLGSIGQRHLSNLRSIYDKDDFEVLAYRCSCHNKLIRDGQAKECPSLSEHYGFQPFHDLDKALDVHPDAVFITNPSSLHIPVALKAARRGCHLFIEKPLSDSMEGVEELSRICSNGNLTVMVGYQTRFHPCLRLIRGFLSQPEYGRIRTAHFTWATYLPGHHPYEDYRRGYAARHDLGGGVVLGLSHELDLIISLWGQARHVTARGGHWSDLEMDVEDTVEVKMRFQDLEGEFPVKLDLTYAGREEVRFFTIERAQARLECDLNQNSVNIRRPDGTTVFEKSFPDLRRNDLFLAEIREFLNAVHVPRQPLVSLQEGIESLNLALRIKEAIGEECPR